MTTAEQLKWADKFEGELTRILSKDIGVSRSAVYLPDEESDKKDCMDFAVETPIGLKVVLARMRSLEGGGIFYNRDFTMRESFKKKPFVITEMEKVFLQNKGDLLLYGLADDELNVHRYRLCSLKFLRANFEYIKERHTVISRSTGLTIGRLIPNPAEDDSNFWTFPWVEMPEKFLISGSRLPRKDDAERAARAKAMPMFA